MDQGYIKLTPLYKFCIAQYKKYASFIIGATVTFFVLAIIPQVYFVLKAPKNPTMSSQIISLLINLFQLLLSIGFTKIMLLLIQDEFVEVSDLFNNGRFFLNYFVASFLYSLAVMVGLILLIIPGIYVAIRLLFYPYFILEHNDTALTAFKKSYEATKDLTRDLFIFGASVLILNLLGLLCLGVGIVFTYPLTTMATAVVYKGLINDAESIPSKAYQP